ncbi:hypothetical protein GCM10010492_71190 [Saccharothrix mutabilis subsp. mutabilis]|uniref:Restriction endonuclease n=1 Tax=Saccharothrix mutabilis subsp. mutabilis TaxID=66855 RepID=A0ABP3EDB1_9PSEU
MTDTRALLGEIRSLLGSSVDLTGISSNGADDIYEVFIFSLAAAFAHDRGADVKLVDHMGRPTNELKFRRSPGQLFARDHSYTHALIRFGFTPPLELHIGIRVQGGSGVLHEADVLMLPQEEADISRQAGVAPRAAKCNLVIECKHYVNSSLDLGLARNFQGLYADLHVKHSYFVANRDSISVARYFQAQKREYEQRVSPGSREASYLQAKIRGAFRDYLAKHDPSIAI